MEAKPFEIEQILNAPLEVVWHAITNKDEMRQWYFDLSDFKPEKGFQFEFPGKGNEGQHYLHQCTIIEADALKKLSYSWSYKDIEGYSVVTFELAKEGDGTILKLIHSGLESFPKHPDFAPESFAKGWSMLIGELLPAYIQKRNN